MFAFRLCAHEGCNHYASTGSNFCLRHSQDQAALLAQARRQLLGPERLDDFCITSAVFDPMQIPQKKTIAGCNFAWCTFHRVDFSGVHLISSFFDFCMFDQCLFHDIDCRYTVFSGSKLVLCDFTGSFIVHSNFSGIDSLSSTFNSCDLYYSNFSSSFLKDTPFEDCNLKKTNFAFTDQRRVSFKYSNPEEIIRV
ncbi:MAG: pentapeptide repeat-containing protein [Sphaerochaetaceae bacterium]|nr:pentapeptide repeat-containing protein [Spirochaetaceae bacterium]MDY6344633.1 pentapeptide repeat-containing protein [Sphaerochaetaceae bacterium]